MQKISVVAILDTLLPAAAVEIDHGDELMKNSFFGEVEHIQLATILLFETKSLCVDANKFADRSVAAKILSILHWVKTEF